VMVLAADAGGRKVEVGDELARGARLRLGRASQVTVLWAHGESTTIRGPRNAALVVPREYSQRGRTGSLLAVAANVWNAVRNRLKGLVGGREEGAVLTEEPLAVRGPDDEWQMRPADECILPGSVELCWRGPSEECGEYSVVIWDASFTQIWKGEGQGHEITVPTSVGLGPGRRYWWVVSSGAETAASSPLRWFEILTPERLTALDEDLRCVQDLFQKVSPASQLHVAMGCIYEWYGLLSEARAQYRTAAELSPATQAYQALVDQTERAECSSPNAESGDHGTDARR
jgi:hypothetical protein